MQLITSPKAKDGSTYVVTADFTDEDGVAVIPNSIEYKLTDINGSVINGKSAEAVTPASSVEIVLSGLDLQRENGEYFYVTITADYDSSLGNGLPLVDQGRFSVADFVE